MLVQRRRLLTRTVHCSHHGWHLLDAEQDIPWQDQKITYYLKYRLYFQEYDPSQHIAVFDNTWSIGGLWPPPFPLSLSVCAAYPFE